MELLLNKKLCLKISSHLLERTQDSNSLCIKSFQFQTQRISMIASQIASNVKWSNYRTTRQVSSMIHSARPTATPVANIVFCYFVLLNLESGDGWTTCAKTMIPTGRDCGLAEWINTKKRYFMDHLLPQVFLFMWHLFRQIPENVQKRVLVKLKVTWKWAD